jgi:carotenoid 1,2-hydratase
MHASDAAAARGFGAEPHLAGGIHAAAHAGGFRAAEPLDGWSPLWTGLARVGGVLPAPGQPDADPWALLRGRQHPSRRGRAHGGVERPAGGRLLAQGPRFDVVVEPGGYAWWYIDAFSDDRRHGLTIIAFIGSVFSPYYKLSGRDDPENHCAINIALNGPRSGAWTMTERRARAVARDADHFVVGPSGLAWDGDSLVISIRERSMPLGYRVAGEVRVTPRLIGTTAFALDPQARHRWHPVAPRARVEVKMTHPGVSWSGEGYWDSNFGDEALEEGFVDWHWSRAHLKDEVAVLYGGRRTDGRPFDLALSCDAQGRWRNRELPPVARLRRSNWLVERLTRADPGSSPRVAKTWIDAPFYARSAIDTRLWGQDARAVHESLSLTRFASPIVQSMLPYRMPRAVF